MKKNRIIKKAICAIVAALLLLPVLCTAAFAATERKVAVYIDGRTYSGSILFKDSVTYVGIRDFSNFMGASDVSWDSETKTAAVRADNLRISSENSCNYIIANERYLWAATGIFIRSGTMFVPLRTIAKAFNCNVNWDGTDFAAYVTKNPGEIQWGDEFYDSDEVYWLSRIINAEAGVEPFIGKIAVGNVVLNRVRSPQYPDTVYGVIFDSKFGVQFTPAANGTVYNEPNTDSIIAAKLCLDGARLSDRALFFVNDAIAENSWVRDNRPYITTIGSHNFYA